MSDAVLAELFEADQMFAEAREVVQAQVDYLVECRRSMGTYEALRHLYQQMDLNSTEMGGLAMTALDMLADKEPQR